MNLLWEDLLCLGNLGFWDDGQIRWVRLSDVLKVLDVADGLLLLSKLVTDPAVGNERVESTNHRETSENQLRLRLADDNNGGVTRLSAYLVTQSFPVGRRGSSSIVYQSRHRVAASAAVVESDKDGANPWIVDPRPLSGYGEVLHTPYGVLDQLS
ncbi:hypothetical protein Hanom_Chr12g01172721 [Helianthus anomalus]